jgi:hypothetical protein
MLRGRMKPLFLALSFLFFTACIGDGADDDATTSAGAGGTDDGLYRPPPSGVQISQDAACQIVKGAVEQRAAATECVMTIRDCPLFLTSQPAHSPHCALYDEGAAQGCAAYYAMMPCTELRQSQGTCVVKTYPGTEPAGCP